MEKKEQTNGGSHLIIGEFTTNENREIQMPPEKSKKLSIASVAKLKELEETEYLEINVEYHEAFKEGEKIVKRVSAEGKTLTDETKKNKKNEEVETR